MTRRFRVMLALKNGPRYCSIKDTYRQWYQHFLKDIFGQHLTYPTGASAITSRFWWCSFYLVLSFFMLCHMYCSLSVCLFNFFSSFYFSFSVVTLLSIFEFDCPSDIFHPSFTCRSMKNIPNTIHFKINMSIEDFYCSLENIYKRNMIAE